MHILCFIFIKIQLYWSIFCSLTWAKVSNISAFNRNFYAACFVSGWVVQPGYPLPPCTALSPFLSPSLSLSSLLFHFALGLSSCSEKCFWFVFDLFELVVRGSQSSMLMSRLATKTAKNSHKQITMPPPLAIAVAVAEYLSLSLVSASCIRVDHAQSIERWHTRSQRGTKKCVYMQGSRCW